MKKKRPIPTPRQARSFADICLMPRDNVGTRDFWILADVGEVTLAQQKQYEAVTADITIPRKVFDAFVDWYMTGKWLAPHKKR